MARGYNIRVMGRKRMKAAKPPKKPKAKRANLSFRSGHREIDTSRFKGVGWLILQMAIVIGLAFVVVKTFGYQVKCDNVSMSSTIESGDTVLIDKLVYKMREPEAGDVIAFISISNIKNNYSIKRIVACPGDRVIINNGKLYVNDEVVKDNYSKQLMKEAGRAAVELTIGPDEYFVLGDNRNVSEDSRYELIGNVKKEYIIGKVFYDLSQVSTVN